MSEATADEADDDVDDRYCDDRKDNKYCQQPQQRVIPGLSHLRKLFFGLVLRKNGGIRRKRVGYAVEGNDAMCHFLDDELSLDYVPSQKAVVRAFDTAAWQSVRSLLNKSLQTTKLKQNNEFKSPYLKKANPCDCEASTSNK